MLQRLLILAPFFHIVLHDDLLNVSRDHGLILLAEGDICTDKMWLIDNLLGLRGTHVLMDVADVLGH